MDSEILDAVTEWGDHPVSDGVVGLYDLAGEEFSGAVTDGAAWTFVLNGRYLGVFDGAIDDFEDASLTAYTAPDSSLPLLYAMRAGGGQTRGQYYSNETPLTEIDGTLSSGNFVGYVELSENVLSGDYYVVYYGGRSLPVAYVGNSRRLLTGDEAFERAADEVGIYSVVDADIDVVELPQPDPREGDESGAPPATGTASDAATTDPDPETDRADAAFDAVDTGDGTDDDATDEAFAAASTDRTPTDDTAGDDADAMAPDWVTPEVVADDTHADGDDADADADTPSDAETTGDTTTEAAEAPATADDPEPGGVDADGTVTAADAGTVTTEDVAVDPVEEPGPDSVDDTETDDEDTETDDRDTETDDEDTETDDEDTETDDEDTNDRATAAGATDGAESTPTDAADGAASAAESMTDNEAARLRRELDAVREAKSEVEAERDRIATERDEHRAAAERLEERVAELEAEIERLESDDPPAASRSLTPAEALAGTNLFVRYEDKTAGTLERAAQGRIDESTLRDNLRIAHHTEFETGGVSVDGRPFEAFLRETTEYRFVEWLLTALTYEIRRTDTRPALSKLYEAIERIDRIDLGGTVDVTDEARPEPVSESFDVIFRDKMGDPLFVAAFDEGRDPTAAPVVEELIDGASRVSERAGTLAAAFFVSTSFFDSEAMKTAVDATRGGLFSRSSRRSYVKISRKAGFHLCLVEARDDEFFLTVPEL